jgi:O-antigen ligase
VVGGGRDRGVPGDPLPRDRPGHAGRPQAGQPGAGRRPRRLASAGQVWADSAGILRDFPVLGTGLGASPRLYPHYKSADQAQTTALSSLLEWAVEAGIAGLVLLALATAWCARRLPGALARVGTADRALAFGLVGAATSFGLLSAIHWTVELSAIALAASALGGAWDRWLAGGTDLFV